MGSTYKLTSIVPAAMVAATIAAPGMASAADLLIDPPVIEAPEVITKAAGGWYLRGDITYDFQDTDEPMFATNQTVNTFTTASVDDAFDLGIGIGYQITENFRVDLTGDYIFETDFDGTTTGSCGTFDGTLAGTVAGTQNTTLINCTSVDTSSYTAFKLLANAYFDLGNYNGFTPYVGAGIGGAYVDWDGLSNAATCTAVAGVTCPVGGIPVDQHAGASQWRFAWAAHLGFSYDISHNVKLDLGYSYSKIEDGEFFNFLDGSGVQGYDKGIDSHVIHAGVRNSFW